MSRPSSPSGSTDTPGLAPRHEAATGATLAASASPSPSPVPPTPPPKDVLFTSSPREPDAAHTPPPATAMSKLGLKAGPPEIDDPTELMVIDISGPPYDPDETIRVDADADGADGAERSGAGGPGDETPARESDVTDADITIVHPDGPEGEREREHVQEHPLRLDVYPPSPPRWERDLEGGDADEDEDVGMGMGMGRGGRASPQRFVFSSAKAQRVHEYGNGNGNGSKPKIFGRPRIPHSAYYFGPPPPDSAYGTEPCGQIGVHHPREVVRIERDYTGGELPQFTPTYPLELEGRITPTQFLETINAINEILLSAHSLGHAFVDNTLAYFSLQISRVLKKTHYEKEMERLHALIDELNVQMYNPVGLHIRWPRSVAFLFLEIEYYVRVMEIIPRALTDLLCIPSDPRLSW
ncbi:Golgin subfamily A member 7/ERF4 family-domain-containing protein [Cerioporus squamosus]|nr:Golgin subfamily A member 7/ERF4 family-domain-containing protein [Cerioporus squamosus]